MYGEDGQDAKQAEGDYGSIDGMAEADQECLSDGYG